MWRKKKDPLLELLGYDSEQGFVTADDVLMATVQAILDGNLETVVDVCQLQSIKKEDLASVRGIIKGHAAIYIKKFFAKSAFHVVEVEENADETQAVIHLKGKTVSAKELVERSLLALEQSEDRERLLTGKLDLRQISLAMGVVEEIMTKLEATPVSGVVHMEKCDGNWKMADNDELSQVMIRASAKGLEQVLLQKFASVQEREQKA